MTDSGKPYVIVVGVDYSETGDLAFDQALAIARAHPPSEVHAVNVVYLGVPPESYGYAQNAAYASVPLTQMERELREYVEQKSHDTRGDAAHEPGAVVSHVRFNAPAREIAQLAADLEADLVVVGTHGRRGASRALIGSVAEVVARLAPCPVLVVRPRRVVGMPRIHPPCAECLKVRRAPHGERLWCDLHGEHHGQRQGLPESESAAADGGTPLVFHG